MRRCARILFGVMIAIAVSLSASARGPSEEDDEAQQRRKAAAAQPDVLRLADSLDRDEDEIEKQADRIAAKHDLLAVSWVFKWREQGGLGVGPKPGAYDNDGMEVQLLQLGGKRPLTPKELKDRRNDYLQMAKVTLAVARVTPLYAARYVPADDGLRKKNWDRGCRDTIDSAEGLIGALKGDDPEVVWKAARRLNDSCNVCHLRYEEP